MIEKTNNEEIIRIPLDKILLGDNIRTKYKEEELDELAESLKNRGQLQNIQVFENEGKFEIIFGHRRYLAAQKANLQELTCVVVSKPSKKEIIYRQIVENEQSETMTPEDREGYIKKLLDMGDSFDDIAKKINKSSSWVRQCAIAANARLKFQSILSETGFNATTTDLNFLKNATPEEVREAVKLVTDDAENKRKILKEISIQKKKKMNSGKKPKKSLNGNYLNLDIINTQNKKDLGSSSVNSTIRTDIIYNEDGSISLNINNINLIGKDFTVLLDSLSKVFKDKGLIIMYHVGQEPSK